MTLSMRAFAFLMLEALKLLFEIDRNFTKVARYIFLLVKLYYE